MVIISPNYWDLELVPLNISLEDPVLEEVGEGVLWVLMVGLGVLGWVYQPVVSSVEDTTGQVQVQGILILILVLVLVVGTLEVQKEILHGWTFCLYSNGWDFFLVMGVNF